MPIPPSLNRHLVDEWNMITNEPNRLVKLPKPTNKTVEKLIKDFVTVKMSELNDDPDEVC